GYIDFPILGKLKIAGLNRTQASELFKSELKEYVADANVNIQLMNFKITVLGDVLKPGTFEILDERISLLEAIGLAQDLNLTGLRTNVLLIRENSGIKEEIRIDLTSKSFLKSKYYYLKQNDVIYVEPNKFKLRSQRIGAYLNTGLTIISLLVTSILFISK
ncbi:MAG: polysaccharide biosynthesis/export family protein, partial [Flavobacteriia bacterium]